MLQTAILVVLIISFCDCRIVNKIGDHEILQDPDMFRNVSQLITSKGYPLEEYTVQTADGFLLSMQRIPHGRNERFKEDGKQAVLLQHGLLSTASDWVINFPKQSLGFILADAGYDVWLGNTRGNTYSKRHVKYTPDMQEFWNYSFDEMGAYDVPAMVDHVLNVTGEEKIYYVGHSQGTTQAFALLSERPEYNKKIKLFIALAPVAYAGYITSAISYLAPFVNDLDFLSKVLGVKELLPDNIFMRTISELACDSDERFLCKDIMFALFGADKYQLNQTRLGVYTVQLIGGSSTKSVVHYGQLVNSKLFRKYDYGKHNVDRYNQSTPPEYDVSQITTPVALIWSMNDKLGDPVDVDILQGRLKSLVSSYCVPFPQFNHADYVLAVDAKTLVYDQVLSLLSKHQFE